MSKKLPINVAARNAVWVYDALVAPRFAGAPSILESKRSHEIPDFDTLPEGANVAVEVYGGAFTLRLDGELRRVYVRRFEYASFTSERDVRHAFLTLWREVEALESAAEVGRVAGEWLERWRQK
ncbi:MAG: hypothetical protein M3R15_23980 [Acidobacteriota bacterium]|nr:hypothetical protein [Acidobacteriota bacterium]